LPASAHPPASPWDHHATAALPPPLSIRPPVHPQEDVCLKKTYFGRRYRPLDLGFDIELDPFHDRIGKKVFDVEPDADVLLRIRCPFPPLMIAIMGLLSGHLMKSGPMLSTGSKPLRSTRCFSH